jgi:IS1 family transposase
MTPVYERVNPDEMIVNVEQAGAAELDEMWSFVGKKGNQHWLWDAIAHQTGAVLAYVFGRRQDAVCLQCKTLLEPCGHTRFSTAHWGAYTRHSALMGTAQANATRKRLSASI